jgi:hypothetical protein
MVFHVSHQRPHKPLSASVLFLEITGPLPADRVVDGSRNVTERLWRYVIGEEGVQGALGGLVGKMSTIVSASGVSLASGTFPITYFTKALRTP